MNNPDLILKSISVLGCILLMLILERLIVSKATTCETGKAFIRRHPILSPNGISILRMPQGIVSIILISCFGWWIPGILWFSFWMITDLSDGTIARNCDLVTESGKWVDPLSDKFMHFPALLYLAFGGGIKIMNVPENLSYIPTFFKYTVVCYCVIDAIGQLSRLFSSKKAANSFGKAKTALVTILITGIAFYQMSPVSFLGARLVCAIMIFCTILAFLSFYCKVVPDYWYANSLTALNLLCGLSAITLIWFGTNPSNPDDLNPYLLAFLLIFLGQFFDMFDGRLARKFGSTSWGPLFDDIADATSFGLAVASMIWKSLAFLDNHIASLPALLIALIYLVCLIFRLYRFLHPSRTMPAGIFEGMPAPAGAMMACSAVLIGVKFCFPGSSIITIVLVLLASGLMISHIPYKHFGRTLWPNINNSMRLVLLLSITIFICYGLVKYDCGVALILFCSFMAVSYTILGIAGKKYVAELAAKENNKN